MRNLRRLAALAALLWALPAGAATIAIQPGGDIGPLAVDDILVLDNTWRLETTDAPTAWAWSFLCDGCTIESYLVMYTNAPPGPPSTPGATVDWQGDGSVVGPTLPGYANDGTLAGSIGGFNFLGSTGNGADVLIGKITIRITATTGSVTPYFQPQDGVSGGAGSIPTDLTGVTWLVPEPGTGLLFGLGLGGIGILRRRSR